MAKVLIIRLTSLGDVIFTLPLVNALKKAGYEVDYLVSERGVGVVEGNSAISKVHFVPLMKWRKEGFKWNEFLNLVKKLRAEMFKSLFWLLLCGAKRRITFKDAREGSVFAGNEFVAPKAKFRDYNYHIVERNLDFARYLGIEPDEIKFPLPAADEVTMKAVDELLKGIDGGKKTIVIAPATTWKNKHWNVQNWKSLVEQLKDKYNLVFTGTDKDLELIDRIGAHGLNIAGKTNLASLLEVFRRVDMVISVDSGSSNLAWSSGKPSVITIFTCTPAKRFGPYNDDKKYFTLCGKLSCQPCFKKKCRMKECECVNYPQVDEIIKIVNSVLA